MSRRHPTIVGVVANAVDQSLRANAVPTVYQPLSQFSVPLPLVDMSLSVRAASGSPAMLARSVSATSVDRSLSFTFHPLEEQVSAARQRERLVAWLSGFFGRAGLLLAGIGLHGVMSFAVEKQRVEIGIRMALGAQRADVITLTVRHTLIMTVRRRGRPCCRCRADSLLADALVWHRASRSARSSRRQPCSSLWHSSPATCPPVERHRSIRWSRCAASTFTAQVEA